jgi:hypothetical protein
MSYPLEKFPRQVLCERVRKAEAALAGLESERDTLRDLLVTCRIRCERAETLLAITQRKLNKLEGIAGVKLRWPPTE